MDFDQAIRQLNPEIYERLKTAVELGKWPNGEPLSREQRGIAMQAVIAYEQRHLPPEERTGYIHRDNACANDTADSDAADAETEAPLRWK